MKTLGTVTFAVLVLVILSGCGASQQVGFGSAGNAKASSIDCNSADLEITAQQIQAEIEGYENNCLEVPADLLEAANQVIACFEVGEEKTISGSGMGGSTTSSLTNSINQLANVIKNTNETTKGTTANMRKVCASTTEEAATQEKTISGSGMGGSTSSGGTKPSILKLN